MKKAVLILLVSLIVASMCGCSIGKTIEDLTNNDNTKCSSKDFATDSFYVYEGNSLENDLDSDNKVFKKAGLEEYTFVGDEIDESKTTKRALFFDENNLSIPTVTSKNPLLFVSNTKIPDEIVFERFRDDGVSIGLANLIRDKSDHYYLVLRENDGDAFKNHVDMTSDVKDITELKNVDKLYVGKIGDINVTPDTVTNGGVIEGLEKDKSYIVTFYAGTNYQDYYVTANRHVFTSLETVKSYAYELLHSNCIEIKIPEYFKSGYYLVNGIGFIRYISDSDISKAEINYNDPMLIYDEMGFLIFNPSDMNNVLTEEMAKAKEKVRYDKNYISSPSESNEGVNE